MRQCIRIACLVAGSLAGAGGLSAEPIEGAWRTEPDGKGQTGMVRVTECGGAHCGTIVSARGPDGGKVVTENVGRTVLREMSAVGPRRYRGRVYVPVMGAEFDVEARVGAERMNLRACNAMGLCRERTWRRVQ